MQKQLKEEQGKVTMIYSFETEEEMLDKFYEACKKDTSKTPVTDGFPFIPFMGTKTELKELGEEFWKPLVKHLPISGYFWNYRLKLTCEPCATAKESGISAIEDMKEFIIIAQEEKK